MKIMVYHYKVVGIDCPMCALNIQPILHKHFNSTEVFVNIFTHVVTINTWLNIEDVNLTLELCQKDFMHNVRFVKLE
ncbi:MAG: hypothetical protein ACI4V7_01350 [Succinivibrionaceae bacterium]